jgi:hypothetical protein
VSVNRVHANHDHNYQYHDEKRREKVIILSIEIKIDLNERNEIEIADTIKASVVYQTVTRSSTRIHIHTYQD